MSPLPLTVRALGPLTDLLDAAHAGKWKYLQSPELLLYLMCETDARGKTRAQIENALPIPSSEGSDDNFQARYREVRQRIGSERILYEDGRYRFNFALPCEFDVREFERLVREAQRVARSDSAQAIALFQQALALYRGDFMEGHTKRRSARSDWDADEREWYLVKREELRAARYDCLQQLSALLFEARQHRAGVEINRLLVQELDDDDDAHYRLLYALGAQGQRSAALRHYKQLRERRGQGALDPKLDALVQQIKRGEIADATPTAPAFTPPLAPPFQVPADLPRFVGRTAQFEILQTVVSLQSPVSSHRQQVVGQHNSSLIPHPSSLCLVGMGGIGKTSLAIHAAYRLRESFPDGVLWGNLRESEPLAILASWERAFGCDFSGLPDLNARAASFRSLMNDKRVLVILDDVTDAADARPLLQNGAHTRTLFTTRSADIAAALDALLIEMPVLDADESADLLTRILGKTRVAGQEYFAREIGELLGHLPLALDITAQRLVSRPYWTLREMTERLRAQLRRLDELQLADRAVRATFATSWDTLDDAQKNVLAHVGVFDARSFTAEALAYVVGDVIASGERSLFATEAISSRAEEIASDDTKRRLAMTSTRDILDALVALSLVSFENATRYRQHPLLADFSREKLDDRPPTADGNSSSVVRRPSSALALARLSEYYLSFATTHRKNFLALEDEWDNLNVGIEIAHAQEMWQTVIDYGDVLTDAWFARGRFTDARKNYSYVMRGAQELEEQDPYIAATLHWGKACIDQGDYAEAQEHLQHGLQTSREVNDEYNIANALFLLGRVSVERSEYDAAQKFLERSQAIREQIGDRAGVAETLYMQARIHSRLTEDEKALQIGTEALKIHEKIAPNHAHIVTLRLVAEASGYLNQFDAAEQYMNHVFALCDQLNDESERSVAFYDMATILRRSGRLDMALEYAKKSLHALERMGDRKIQAHALNQLSRIANALEDYVSALAYGYKSLKLYQELEDILGQANIALHIGDVLKQTGAVGQACQIWEQGLGLAEEIKYPLAETLRERLEQNCGENFQKAIDTLL
jgi:tetratricopeptide (TPR) repeat protein